MKHKSGIPVYYDLNTSNTSFIKMAYTLKNLGVKNYYFFLKIYDKSLMGIDPYNENLSEETKIRIQREVDRNFWYFIREVVLIAVPGRLKHFGLNRGNLAMLWCLLNSINCALLLPRQNYKTQSACAFYVWLYNGATNNSDIAYFNKKNEDCMNNLTRTKRMLESLPPYLNRYNKKDTNNETFIKSTITHNSIKAMGTPNNPVSADNLGELLPLPSIKFLNCWKNGTRVINPCPKNIILLN